MAAKKKANDGRAGKARTPSKGRAPSPVDRRAGDSDADTRPLRSEAESAQAADSAQALRKEINQSVPPRSAEIPGTAAALVPSPERADSFTNEIEPSPPGSLRPRFPVVGIGASAGGLEALQEFFSRVPADSGMAFVVVTHQHPGHISLLPTLLGKSTGLSVVEAREGVAVEPNHVYVGPPGGILSIQGGYCAGSRPT